jgi:hypothetical protein
MDTHALEAWNEVHDAAIALHVAGKSNEEIATLLNRDVSWVDQVLSSERAVHACVELERDVVDQVASRSAEIQSRLRAHAGEALDHLVELLRLSTDEGMRFKAATAILDRAGFTAVQRSIVASAELPVDVVDRMEDALRDMKTIEAEYTILGQEPLDA